MAKKLSYSDIRKIAGMTVEEFKKSGYQGNGITGKKYKDDDIQEMIDRFSDAIEDNSDYAKSWRNAVNKAQSAYDEMYDHSLRYLETTANVTDEERDSAYNASVSDNYADGTTLRAADGSTTQLQNIIVAAGDDHVKIDLSEMQTMKKTKLSGGKFVIGTPSDDFGEEAEIGDTRNICGGTVTYLGRENVTYNRGSIPKNILEKLSGIGAWDIGVVDASAHMVHYEGVLGSFDYNADEFSLGYWQATDVEGNTISVPVLHYNNDKGGKNALGMTVSGFLDGDHIKIPEGLKCADYMFAGTDIVSMPELPEGLESSHCMFMNCENLTYASDSAKVKDGIDASSIKMPSTLKDISWMFSGDQNMQDYFKTLNENLVDGRYAFAECRSLGWDGETVDANGKMRTSFAMPDVHSLRYADAFWLANMFDGCDDAVIKKVKAYFDEHGEMTSEWTDSEGVHHNRYDKIADGSYDKELAMDIAENTSRGKILQLTDPDSPGMTGVGSDTQGLASYGVQITDNGIYSDNSLWAKFRQSDFEQTFNKGNQFGEILDRAIPAVGTYAVSKSILNNALGDDHKLISTLGAVGIAAIPQVVGFGNKLSPVLDWTANAVGPETKVGKFLTDLSNKLQGNVTYRTAVDELNADTTFNEFQDSAVDYASNQVNRMMASVSYEGEDNTYVATRFDISKDMKKNGELLAKDANLLFVACEPEENFQNTLSDSIMKTSVEAIRDKMDLELEAAKGDKAKISEVREKYSNYYMTLMYNLNAYDDAAKQGVQNAYASDTELKAQAMNGLEKVMRNTAKPVYDSLYELNKEWEQKYDEPFITDKQMNDASFSMKTMDITGIGSFADYNPAKNYAFNTDIYVEEIAKYQKALTKAVEGADSQNQIDAMYAAYYEKAYGWALDEAESHGVIIDKRDELTDVDVAAFDEYVKQVEAEERGETTATGSSQTEAVANGETAGTSAEVRKQAEERAAENQKRTETVMQDLGLDETVDEMETEAEPAPAGM